MAMSVAQALTQELDTHTPCIIEHKNKTQEKIYSRMHYLVRLLLKVSSEHFSSHQQGKIIDALYFSAKKHAGVYRKDGITPYFMHLLEVVCIIISFGIYDFKIIIAAILHDVVEDTDATLKEIGKQFGAAVRNIVDLMSKHPNFIRKWRYWALMKEEIDLNCRWRVIVLKFCDRIHNMMTLFALPEEKRAEKIAETLREFPSLYKVLVQTLTKLYNRGTIKKKSYLMLPFRLNNRLFYEMGRYEK